MGKLCWFKFNMNWFRKIILTTCLSVSCWLLALSLNAQRCCFVGSWPTGWRDCWLEAVLGFFNWTLCENLAVGSGRQISRHLADVVEGRIPFSSRCSALHLIAQNSSLVESWFASIVVVAMHNIKHTSSKDLWRTQHAVLIGFILLVIWTVFYNGWSFIQVMISNDLPYGLAQNCYYIIELFVFRIS